MGMSAYVSKTWEEKIKEIRCWYESRKKMKHMTLTLPEKLAISSLQG